ncbi:MAG: sporulation protein [Oscillospiraceae bacterium]|nr:sporulation protein [Oscillospiraceae bacterium]
MLDAARGALSLCASTILPSLFPFFVLSILLSRLGIPRALGRRLGFAARLFGVSGAGLTALPVGLLGGYPMGAACVSELLSRGEIDENEAGRLLLFCNNSGPAFLIGAVGAGAFGSARAGFLLYAAHVLAALLTGLGAGLFCRGRPGVGNAAARKRKPAEPFAAAFPAAVRQAVSAALTVCGFVVCFSVLLGLLEAWGLPPLLGIVTPERHALLCGFFEIGSAVGALRGLAPSPTHLALAAEILGWGGLSVHCQTAALFCDSEISLRTHTLGRLCSALLSAAIAGALASLL